MGKRVFIKVSTLRPNSKIYKGVYTKYMMYTKYKKDTFIR